MVSDLSRWDAPFEVEDKLKRAPTTSGLGTER
jgi:hypothetical protein